MLLRFVRHALFGFMCSALIAGASLLIGDSFVLGTLFGGEFHHAKAQEPAFARPHNSSFPYLGQYKVMHRSTYQQATSNFFTLGRPTSSEQPVWLGGRGFAPYGTVMTFERGNIYRSDSGPHRDEPLIVSGQILREYRKNRTYDGRLGFPTSRAYSTREGFQQEFQGGRIIVFRNGQAFVRFNRNDRPDNNHGHNHDGHGHDHDHDRGHDHNHDDHNHRPGVPDRRVTTTQSDLRSN
ncbi:MAG: hypothetical protein C0483_04135 [Pirellula sp.]|nr:hypothetical protein [Pirellula sp.]